MVGFDFIAVVHRVELATYARATTTKSADHAVTCHNRTILLFNSQTQVVLGVLHDARKRYWYRTPYQINNQPSSDVVSVGVGRRQG